MKNYGEKKNILVIGGGGREHALVWKLAQSPEVGKIYAIPGNGGIASLAECHDGIKATDIDKILEFVENHKDIYMTVVAPDDPLALGLVDKLELAGRRAFGPSKAAAQIESSKIFAKKLMEKYGIPTARFETFDSAAAAGKYLLTCDYPVVVKADGLALGKGVVICNDRDSAVRAVREIMLDKSFGSAGDKIIIEEFLVGYEVSLLAFTDGTSVCTMPAARDYKRAHDGDIGLNTGGMGSFCPVAEFSEQDRKNAYDTIVLPTVRAMEKEGKRFKGVLYFGLMVCKNGIKVLEYNARFGDPETQAVLPLLETDIFAVFESVIDEKLSDINIEWSKDKSCVCVVAASGGYPLAYEKGKEISFGDNSDSDTVVFHAGTKFEKEKYLTSGGRVLAVSALGSGIDEARNKAYGRLAKINFEKMFYRKDICSPKKGR